MVCSSMRRLWTGIILAAGLAISGSIHACVDAPAPLPEYRAGDTVRYMTESNAAGLLRIASVSFIDTRKDVRFEYFEDRKLRMIKNIEVPEDSLEFKRDKRGQVTSLILGDGSTAVYKRNGKGRVTSVVYEPVNTDVDVESRLTKIYVDLQMLASGSHVELPINSQDMMPIGF